jgi:hypothetical protein
MMEVNRANRKSPDHTRKWRIRPSNGVRTDTRTFSRKTSVRDRELDRERRGLMLARQLLQGEYRIG